MGIKRAPWMPAKRFDLILPALHIVSSDEEVDLERIDEKTRVKSVELTTLREHNMSAWCQTRVG